MTGLSRSDASGQPPSQVLPTTPASSAPHVVIRADRRAVDPLTIGAPKAAWRLLGWFGGLLVMVGGVDLASQWYPTAFKSAEWEFSVVSVTIASLPLLTIGAVVVLASFLARAKRGGVVVMGVAFAALFLAVGLMLALFASDLPLALRAPAGAPLTAIKKAIVRTLVMGVGYEVAYFIAAITSFRYAFGRIKDA